MDQAVDHATALSRCSALAELPAEAMFTMGARCRRRRFVAGEVLIRQGDPGDSLMVLLAGQATAVLRDADGGGRAVGRLGAYGIFGEMAILTGEPRTTDVVADSSGEALVLTTDDFHALVQMHPDLGVVLTHMVAERLGAQSTDGLGGKVVDRYRIQRCVGRGAMAIVYEARDLETEQTVALKMMSHRLIYERGAMARFQREADLMLSFDHEHVVGVFRRFTAFKTGFIAMEFCRGGDLAAWIGNHPQPDERQVRGILGQMARGLSYLHGRGVVHRDLKPQNVLTTGAGVLKLSDFGLARAIAGVPQEALTVPGTMLGTPYYMAPEQLDGAECSPAGDVYALGCVAMELLTGVPAFFGRTFLEIASKKRAFKMPRRRSIGRGISCRLHARLRACLATRPEDRGIDLDEIGQWSAPVPA